MCFILKVDTQIIGSTNKLLLYFEINLSPWGGTNSFSQSRYLVHGWQLQLGAQGFQTNVYHLCKARKLYVYALLTGKSQGQYEEMLKAVTRRCEDLGFSPDPTTIHMDFEQAAINAVRNTFGPHVQTLGCFYHLTQSTILA